MARVSLHFVIVVFPDYTHLLFLTYALEARAEFLFIGFTPYK